MFDQEKLIAELLNAIDEQSALRPPDRLGKKEYMEGFAHAIPRKRAERMIRAILGLYSDRAGSTASMYGFRALFQAWGIDFDNSKIEWLKDD